MPDQVEALVTIGSNIAPEDNIPAAIRQLDRHPGIELRKVSTVYQSPAEDRPDQPDYHNAAVRLATDLPCEELRNALRGIEAKLGRVRSDDRLAARTIDLDIAFYGDERIEGDGYVIPDPLVSRRSYLAVPLADVDPDRLEPVSGRPLLDVAAELAAEVPLRPVDTSRRGLEAPHRYRTDPEAVAGHSPRLEELVSRMLVELDVDPTREGLEQTPARVAEALDFLTSGYSSTLEEVVAGAVFEEPVNEMVVLKDIEFYSLCEHHLLPFFGKASVGYLPRGRVLGLSKIARIVDLYARRLQVQERLVNQIADGLVVAVAPMGAGVVLEASHFCMMMRGVQKQGSSMITSAMRGTFAGDARTRAEFLELIRR